VFVLTRMWNLLALRSLQSLETTCQTFRVKVFREDRACAIGQHAQANQNR